MVSSLITLVIYIIVIGLIMWLLVWALDQVPMPEPFKSVARVLIIVIGVLILCFMLLGLVGEAPRLKLGSAHAGFYSLL